MGAAVCGVGGVPGEAWACAGAGAVAGQCAARPRWRISGSYRAGTIESGPGVAAGDPPAALRKSRALPVARTERRTFPRSFREQAAAPPRGAACWGRSRGRRAGSRVAGSFFPRARPGVAAAASGRVSDSRATGWGRGRGRSARESGGAARSWPSTCARTLLVRGTDAGCGGVGKPSAASRAWCSALIVPRRW